MCDCKSQSFFVKNNWNSQKPIHLIRKNTTFLLNKRTSTKDTHSRRAHRTKARLEMTNWSKDKEQPVHWNYTETGAPTPVTRNVSPPTALDTSTECARDAAPGEKWTATVLLYAVPDSPDICYFWIAPFKTCSSPEVYNPRFPLGEWKQNENQIEGGNISTE